MDASDRFTRHVKRPLTIGAKTMTRTATSKLLRVVLIAAVPVLAIVSGGGALNKSIPVAAKTCDEIFDDYIAADFTYGSALRLYYHDDPTSCAAVCGNDPGCIERCIESRQAAVADADLALFVASAETCTPVEPDQCDEARERAAACFYIYPPNATLEERLALYDQYSACWTASKIDSCQ
jgi:hypothetical protein